MAQRRQVPVLCIVVVTALVVLGTATAGFAADVTTPFAGKAVNGGTVCHEATGGPHLLSVSADFPW